MIHYATSKLAFSWNISGFIAEINCPLYRKNKQYLPGVYYCKRIHAIRKTFFTNFRSKFKRVTNEVEQNLP